LGDQVDPTKLIREYTEHLGSIHSIFRAAIARQEEEWDQTIRGLIARYLAIAGDTSPVLIAVGFQHSDGTFSEAEHLVLAYLDYRKYLKLKNRSTVNLSKRYVKW
jgi:hypothetical protein